MKKMHDRKLRLNRETVLRLERLAPARGAAAQAGVVRPTDPPETSPLCVSTCCGGCDTQLQ